MRVMGVAVASALLATVAACGGGGGSKTAATPTPTQVVPCAAQTPIQPSPTPAGGRDRIAVAVTGKPGAKPTIAAPKSTAPRTLLTKDVVIGHGKVAGEKSTITAHLIGVHWTNGHAFYSSWDKAGGAPDSFSLCDVIVGFAKGVAGMREGGRREMAIPPTLAYGSKGSGQVGPNETLLFVVDLVKVAQ